MIMERTRNDRIREASLRRRAKRQERMHGLILDEAEKLFLENGYAGFSLRELAESIGYAPTTIYRYFDDKDDLIFALYRMSYERLDEFIRKAFAVSRDPAIRLRAMLQVYFRFVLTQPVHYKFVYIERGDLLPKLEEELKMEVAENTADDLVMEENAELFGLELWRQAVREAVDRGVFRLVNPDLTADAIWSSLHGLAAMHLCCPDVFDRDRFQETSVQMERMCIDAYLTE